MGNLGKPLNVILERVGKKVKNIGRSAKNSETEEKRGKLAMISRNIIPILYERGVPSRYNNCTLDNFEPVDESTTRAFGFSKEFTEGDDNVGEGLFLQGPNGTGKTHLAVAIMRELSLKGELDWFFIKCPYLLMKIREAFKKSSLGGEAELIKKFVDYDYLVIDELGVEKVTDWSLQTLYLIIDGRSDWLKPTIITSNLSLQGIEEKLDPRLASRIVGMSRHLPELTCGDWRLRK